MTRTHKIKASRFARVQFLAQHPELMSGPAEGVPEALKAAGLYSEATKLSDIGLGLPGLLRKARGVIAGASYAPLDSKKPAPTLGQVLERLDQAERAITALSCQVDQLRQCRDQDRDLVSSIPGVLPACPSGSPYN